MVQPKVNISDTVFVHCISLSATLSVIIRTIPFQEFLETMHQFANQGEEEKLSFLFKVEIIFSISSTDPCMAVGHRVELSRFSFSLKLLQLLHLLSWGSLLPLITFALTSLLYRVFFLTGPPLNLLSVGR